MYSEVLGALVTKFPYLNDGSASGHDTLLEVLKNKFKKERRPLLSNPNISRMKEKYGVKRPASAQSLSTSSASSTEEVVLELENVGEDDFSYSQHMSHLLSETLKSRPNTEMMKDLMRRTIFKRLPEMKGTTSEVMEKFPFLKRPNLILHEMKLRFGVDLDLNLCRTLSEMAPKIIKAATSNLRAQRFTRSLLEEEELNEERKAEAERNAAVLLLPILFREGTSYLYCTNEEPANPTPTIVFCGPSTNPLKTKQASVMMDGVTIVDDIPDASLALSCLFCVHFLFGVEYPKQISNTLNFMHHYLFEVNANERRKMSVSVLKMSNQLANC